MSGPAGGPGGPGKRLNDRSDLLVLTFNVDFNPGVVAPYLKGQGYTFPVLLASTFFTQFVELKGIPQSWIVAPDGTVVLRQVGFGGDVTHWTDEVIQRMESVAHASSP